MFQKERALHIALKILIVREQSGTIHLPSVFRKVNHGKEGSNRSIMERCCWKAVRNSRIKLFVQQLARFDMKGNCNIKNNGNGRIYPPSFHPSDLRVIHIEQI